MKELSSRDMVCRQFSHEVNGAKLFLKKLHLSHIIDYLSTGLLVLL